MKPLLTYPGNKAFLYERLLPILKHYQAKGYAFVEPFAGSAALSFKSEYPRVILNDKNKMIYRLLKAFKEGVDIPSHLNGMGVSKESYYLVRSVLNKMIVAGSVDSPLGYAYLFYINKIGYDGLLRVNQKGLINTPFGNKKRLPTYDVRTVKRLMRDWRIENKEYYDLDIPHDALVYVDPPYYKTVGFYKHGTDLKLHQEICKWVDSLPNPVIISNAYEQEIVDLYQARGWNVYKINRQSAFSNRKYELLAFKEVEMYETARND